MATKKSTTPINVQNKQVEPFIYQATLVKVVDGDTIDVTLDLGFNVLLFSFFQQLSAFNRSLQKCPIKRVFQMGKEKNE